MQELFGDTGTNHITFPYLVQQITVSPLSARDAMPGVDYIFHGAALKQVPSCEFFPMEAVKTNIIGTDNVVTAAVENTIEKVVFLSRFIRNLVMSGFVIVIRDR